MNIGPIPARRKSGRSTRRLCSYGDVAARTGRRLSRTAIMKGRGRSGPDPLCAICDHLESLHHLPFVECRHEFVARGSHEP